MKIKILILALICFLLCGCKDKELKPEQVKEQLDAMTIKPRKNETMEYMLASINAGYYLPRDDPSIEKFRLLLKTLVEKFIEDKKQVGDMSVAVKFHLRDAGIQENLLRIMEGMNGLFSSKQENLKYAECATFYLELRKKGYSHNKALEGIKMLLQGKGIY